MSNEVLLHISEKPWGEISEADYTIEQWHSACLIHLHDGPPTSKSQCKLPVKTPNGALNRNGVHAAAAALAGARSPLKASPEQKAKAAAALRRYYSQLDETPPESLMEHTNSLENILEHFGVKGMKWGVRSDRTSTKGVLSRISGKPELKSDEKWRNRTIRGPIADALYNVNPNAMGISRINRQVQKATYKAMKPDIKALNKKPEYNTRQARKEIKAARFGKILKNNTGVADKYYAEHGKIFEKHIKAQAPQFMQTSPSGKWETKLSVSKGGRGPWTVYVKQVDKAKHAADDNPDLVIRTRPIFDDDGFIIDWEFVENDAAQSAIDDVLAHFGVKGMKWGVRRSQPSAVTVSDRRKKIKTSGGAGRPASPDAIRARTIGQVGKKSGLKALSDEDLQTYSRRLQLEQSVKRLNYNEMNPGKKFVMTVLGRSGNSLASEGVNAGTKKLGKKALTLAMAA